MTNRIAIVIWRVPAFWQAVIVLTGAWLMFDLAFPPFMPRSLMIAYMLITLIGVLLFFSSDEQRWSEFKAPITTTLQEDSRWPLRWLLLTAVPLLVGYITYEAIKPSLEIPLELRQVHPAPPGTVRVYNKTYDLTTLENPVRANVLGLLESEPDQAWETYRETVSSGSAIYYRNCFFCHGDLLGGKGHFAKGLDPLPTNFRDVGTIAQLQESFLFWRITTGGPGLPQGGMPWKSAMPVWHEMLSEEEVWSVITFLYDNVDQVPRMWDQKVSKAVTGMKDRVVSQRTTMTTKEIYQFRCAACHGENGAGDGPAAEFLYPKARDFTQGLFKYKTSAVDLPLRDEDLFNVIKHGLTGTSMPGWSALLSDAQISDLVKLIKSFDTSATWAPEDAADEDFDDEGRYLKADFQVITDVEPTAGQIAYSAESVARGAELFEENCRKCHGEQGRGNITSGEFLEDDWGERIWSRDLTKPWTWRITEVDTANPSGDEASRDATIRNIYTRLSVGIPGTPMPAHRAAEPDEEDAINLEDRWHVANYTYSLRSQTTPPSERPIIEGVEMNGELPERVDDETWEQAPASTFRLVPNVVKGERLFTPLNGTITVRAVYNEREIAFLLEVNDRTDSRPGGPVMSQLPDPSEPMYPDALAIQFPKDDAYSTAPVEKPLYRHGDAAHHTTIWYWNAGSVDPPVESRGVLLDATGPDAELSRRTGNSDLIAHGEWHQGRWRVLMKRPRGLPVNDGEENAAGDAVDVGARDLVFSKGRFIPVSFANWEGNNGETRSRHTLTPWFWLLLPPDTNYAAVYGVSLGTTIIVFLAGLVLVRSQRRQRIRHSRVDT